mmetsp:Transcript_19863/g.48607  ORF Transcript_19863/g.48607 Transcript_19863/m.48607 type:complete len:414 (-) Transcript_19863:3523-4764(-)
MFTSRTPKSISSSSSSSPIPSMLSWDPSSSLFSGCAVSDPPPPSASRGAWSRTRNRLCCKSKSAMIATLSLNSGFLFSPTRVTIVPAGYKSSPTLVAAGSEVWASAGVSAGLAVEGSGLLLFSAEEVEREVSVPCRPSAFSAGSLGSAFWSASPCGASWGGGGRGWTSGSFGSDAPTGAGGSSSSGSLGGGGGWISACWLISTANSSCSSLIRSTSSCSLDISCKALCCCASASSFRRFSASASLRLRSAASSLFFRSSSLFNRATRSFSSLSFLSLSIRFASSAFLSRSSHSSPEVSILTNPIDPALGISTSSNAFLSLRIWAPITSRFIASFMTCFAGLVGALLEKYWSPLDLSVKVSSSEISAKVRPCLPSLILSRLSSKQRTKSLIMASSFRIFAIIACASASSAVPCM